MKIRVTLFTVLWLVAALAVMASGALAGAHPPTLQIVVTSETALLLILYLRSKTFADYAREIELWRLTVFHLWRVIPGMGFLLLYSRGLMPHDFALPAGVGELLSRFLPPFSHSSRYAQLLLQ